MAGGERRVLTLFGKGSPLSSASVFEFASTPPPFLLLKLDPSALAKLSSSSSDNPFKFQISIPDYLTPEEARASLLSLLYKLLLRESSFASASASVSASAAAHLLDALNGSNDNSFRSGLEIDVDVTDVVVLTNRWPDAAVHGICALLDYTVSSLASVADAVASLSCEALKADVKALFKLFDLFKDSGDGFSDKDRVSVASDLKVLLKGYNYKGNFKCDQLNHVPIVHGRLRSLSRSVHTATRVELNSIPVAVGRGAACEDLTGFLSSLAFCLQNLGEISWHRGNHCLYNIVQENLLPGFAETFNAGCPNLDRLRDSVMSFITAKSRKDYIKAVHDIYSLGESVREILSWEAAASFFLLGGNELVATFQGVVPLKADVGGGGGNVKLEKKEDKKKAMGKGTTVLVQFIKDKLQSRITSFTDNSDLLHKLIRFFPSLLDIKDPGFVSLLQAVKDVVESNGSRELKPPKGTRDFAREQMAVRERAFSIISDIFKRHGAMALDTPVFELKEILTGKYGEDSKLIYDLADQGGELCSLRYDLTVPFARYVAMKGLTSFRRYQMAKVYRRDNPSKGRYREFYQCDFDIAGDETIGADFEVVKILTELLDELNIGDYEIKLNHRKLLDGMLDICGVPSDKFRTICSSIDKLDKQSFEHIRKEMIEEKGLNAGTVDKIGSFVMLRGHPLELLLELKKEGSEFLENHGSKHALNDLEKLFQALENARCIGKVVLDLSLARGLDYYTGVIFEAVFKGATQVGSIAAGGRYDNLIGMFGTKHVPAVGVSLGIERVLTIMEELQKDPNQAPRASETQILVSVLGDDIPRAAKLVSKCWDVKLKAEFMVNKRLMKHFDRAKASGIPWMVIVGDREISEGIVKLKNKEAMVEVEVPASNFVDELVRLMNAAS